MGAGAPEILCGSTTLRIKDLKKLKGKTESQYRELVIKRIRSNDIGIPVSEKIHKM
jgi:hypothetical protein